MRRSRIFAAMLVVGLALSQSMWTSMWSASATTVRPPKADGFAAATWLLPPLVDSDGDGWMDAIEGGLGSDPADPSSTPEHIALPESCMNTTDDDGDGAIDEADDGCRPTPPSVKTFPAAGTDEFDSSMSLSGYDLATASGVCPIDFQGTGPVVVDRSDPTELGGGLRMLDTEMIAMQINGMATLLAGSPCNPGTEPTSFPASIIEDPAKASTGTVTDTNPDPAIDFPADSFFDVYFSVSTPLGLLPGGPPGGPSGSAVGVTNTVRSIPPYHSPGNPKLNPSCYTVAGLPHQHCPKPPLDHFKCYTGAFATFKGKAVLKDQFGRERVSLRTADRFCNPVSKNGQRIFDIGGHLTRYPVSSTTLEAGFQRINVVVRNQFGVQPMTVVGRAGLFVPSRKDSYSPPAALDHFECYAVKGGSVGQKVRLEDQFDTDDGRIERARILKPVTLCNPVQKTYKGTTIKVGDPMMHLVCYAIDTENVAPRSVLIRNQFGKDKAKVDQPVEVCAPSLKTVVPKIEIDELPDITARVQISTPNLTETVDLTGSATIEVRMGALADTDGDGLEQVQTELVQLDLTGTSTEFGPITINLRDPALDPGERSTGQIEELENTAPGVLDLPPFAPGEATSYFDVFFELHKVVNGVPITIHNKVPLVPTGIITYKPCWWGDIYEGPEIVPLYDEKDGLTPVHIGPVVVGAGPVA